MRRSQAPSQVGANKKPKIGVIMNIFLMLSNNNHIYIKLIYFICQDFGPSGSPGIGIKSRTTQKSNVVTPGIKSSQDILNLFDTNERDVEEAVNTPTQQVPPMNKYNARAAFSEKNASVTPAAGGETVK